MTDFLEDAAFFPVDLVREVPIIGLRQDFAYALMLINAKTGREILDRYVEAAPNEWTDLVNDLFRRLEAENGSETN